MPSCPITVHVRASGALRLVVFVVVLFASNAGCTPAGKPDPQNQPVAPNEVMDFGRLFATNCAGCHGAAGEFGPAPPLNDPLFVTIISDEDLLGVIQSGRPGTPMPAFARKNGGGLTDGQVKALVAGIKSHWKADTPLDEAPPAYAVTAPNELQSTPANRERGARVFERACLGCHGPNGAGGEQNGINGGAISSPAFLSLISDQALRRIIITGRPDLGMPSYADSSGRPADYHPLTSTEIDDLVALLAEWRSGASVARVER
jgi:mono/diheme cytochrome c family protein